MREAANGEELKERILKEIGLEVDIIDGDKEADIIYQCHLHSGLASRS